MVGRRKSAGESFESESVSALRRATKPTGSRSHSLALKVCGFALPLLPLSRPQDMAVRLTRRLTASKEVQQLPVPFRRIRPPRRRLFFDWLSNHCMRNSTRGRLIIHNLHYIVSWWWTVGSWSKLWLAPFVIPPLLLISSWLILLPILCLLLAIRYHPLRDLLPQPPHIKDESLGALLEIFLLLLPPFSLQLSPLPLLPPILLLYYLHFQPPPRPTAVPYTSPEVRRLEARIDQALEHEGMHFLEGEWIGYERLGLGQCIMQGGRAPRLRFKVSWSSAMVSSLVRVLLTCPWRAVEEGEV